MNDGNLLVVSEAGGSPSGPSLRSAWLAISVYDPECTDLARWYLRSGVSRMDHLPGGSRVFLEASDAPGGSDVEWLLLHLAEMVTQINLGRPVSIEGEGPAPWKLDFGHDALVIDEGRMDDDSDSRCVTLTMQTTGDDASLARAARLDAHQGAQIVDLLIRAKRRLRARGFLRANNRRGRGRRRAG